LIDIAGNSMWEACSFELEYIHPEPRPKVNLITVDDNYELSIFPFTVTAEFDEPVDPIGINDVKTVNARIERINEWFHGNSTKFDLLVYPTCSRSCRIELQVLSCATVGRAGQTHLAPNSASPLIYINFNQPCNKHKDTPKYRVNK